MVQMSEFSDLSKKAFSQLEGQSQDGMENLHEEGTIPCTMGYST